MRYGAPENIFGPGIQIFTAPKYFMEHLSLKEYLDHYMWGVCQKLCRKLLVGIAILLITFSMPLSKANTGDSKSAPPSELNLKTALEEVLSHSPEIQKAQADIQEKRWRRFETFGAGFLPRLSVSANHYFVQEYTNSTIVFSGNNMTFPGMYPADQVSFDAMIPIFNGFSNIYQLEAATLLKEASEQELKQVEFRLQEETRLAFYQALAAFELQKVSDQNVKTMQDHLNQVNAQKKEGVATNYDMLRVEVQLNEARADVIDTNDNAAIARKKLTQLMGLETDDRLLQGELPTPDISKVKNLTFSETPPDRRDIEAINLRAKAAGKRRSAQSVWLVPSISLSGQYLLYNAQIYNNTVMNTGHFNSAYNVGVFLKWNLFDGGMSLAQAHETIYQAIQAEKTSEMAKLQVPYDFAYWKRRYLSNSDHYISKQLDIKRSEESVRLAKIAEQAGSRTSSDVLDAELDLFRARAGRVNAQLNATEAQIRLELALGREL